MLQLAPPKSLLVIIAAVLAGAALLAAAISPALACSPGLGMQVEITEDDTPQCLTFYQSDLTSLRFDNVCQQEVELESLECDGDCDTNLVMAPGQEDAELVLDAAMGEDLAEDEFSRQTYAWTMGDETGMLATEIHHDDSNYATDCATGSACSSTGNEGPGAAVFLFFFGLAALALRRDMARVNGRRRRH